MPYYFVSIVCFVESSLVRIAGMSRLRIKEGLGQITGSLEALVESAETHQDMNAIRESSG